MIILSKNQEWSNQMGSSILEDLIMQIKKLENKQCLICDKSFKNFAGLQIHKSKKHKRIDVSLYQIGPQKIVSLSNNEYCVQTIDEIFNYPPKKEENLSDWTSMEA